MTTATRTPRTVSSYSYPGPVTADRDGYDPDAQQPDPRPGYYYVTAYDSARPAGRRYAFLAGPYRCHAHALRDLRAASDLAIQHDPWLAFVAFGTSGIHDPAPGSAVPVGALNDALDIDPDELREQPQPDEPAQAPLFALPAPQVQP